MMELCNLENREKLIEDLKIKDKLARSSRHSKELSRKANPFKNKRNDEFKTSIELRP